MGKTIRAVDAREAALAERDDARATYAAEKAAAKARGARVLDDASDDDDDSDIDTSSMTPRQRARLAAGLSLGGSRADLSPAERARRDGMKRARKVRREYDRMAAVAFNEDVDADARAYALDYIERNEGKLADAIAFLKANGKR